jgi:hypothetical protein
MIDQLTRRKRAEFFMRRNFAEHITAQQERNHMNTIRLIRRTPVGLRRIGRFGLSEREMALKRALFVSRRSAKLADAAVDATVSIGAFERLSPEEKYILWNRWYEEAVNCFKKTPEVRDDPELIKQMSFLQRFFMLPTKLFEQRKRHGQLIEKVLRRSIERFVDPEINYRQQLDNIARKAKIPGTDITVFAMDVCVAASIYADMKEHAGKNWTEAYQNGMETAYFRIKEFHELVDAIAAL